MTKGIEVPLTVNTDGAEKAIKDVKKSVGGLGDAFTSAIDFAGKFGLAIDGVKKAADMLVGAFDAVGDTLGAVHDRMDLIHRADLFGSSIDEAQELQKTLSDVKTTMGAMKLATELRTAGFNKKEIGNFGGMINAIAAVTQGSKQQIEQALLAGGRLTERQLRSIGKNRTDVALLFQQEMNRLGGRQLDELEKARVLTKAWGADLKQLDQELGRLGASNPFDDIKMSVKSVGEEIKISLMGPMRDFSEWVRKHKDEWIKTFTAVVEFVRQSFTMLPKFIKSKMGGALKSVTSMLPAWAKKIAKVGGAVLKASVKLNPFVAMARGINKLGAKTIKDTKTEFKKLRDVFVREHKDRVKLAIAREKEISKKTAAVKAKIRKAIIKNRGTRTQQQARLEAAQEHGARIKAARTLMRNFEEEQFSAISRLGAKGGAQLVAGIKQSINTFRILAARFGKNFMASNLAGAKKARSLMNLTLESGTAAADKITATAKQRNNLLKAGLSIFGQDAKIAALKNEGLNEEKSIKAVIRTMDLAITAAEKSKLPILKRRLGFLKQFRQTMMEQRDIARQVAAIRIKAEVVDLKAAGAMMQLKLKQQGLAADERMASIREKLRGQRRGVDPAAAIRDAASKTIQQTQLQMEQLAISAQRLNERLNIKGLLTGESRDAIQAQLDMQNSILEKKRQEIDLVKELRDEQIAATTAVGSFLAQAAQQSTGFTQKLGQNLFSAFQSGIGGIGNLVSSTMSSIVSGVGDAGAQAGKLFLDVLAGAAAQLGSYFLAAGAAQMFIPPYTGAGAVAGGLGLLALSGTLKGLGSLAGASASAPSVSSSSAASPPKMPTQLPGSKSPEGQRAVNFFFASAPLPWQRDSQNEQAQAREMQKWGQRMEREGIDPFTVPRRFGARSFG